MIRITNLGVAFGGVTALDDLSIALDAPVTGIVGPNGAGKTTLLNALSGFVAVSAVSQASAFGSDLLAMAPHARARWGLRRAFQAEQVVDALDVADNIRVALDGMPISAAARASHLDKVLEFSGLAPLARRQGAVLNAFERRMVEIARALVGNPKVVLLDEPAGGLGQHESVLLQALIARIHAEFGALVLLVDHDMDLIRATCSQTMVLDFGHLVAHGPTGAVLADPAVQRAYLGEAEEAA